MVKIITDTTSVLPRQVAEKYHIPVIPQVIHFDDETYLEGIEIDNATFLRKLKSSRNLPKTSAPPPDLFAQEFAKVQDPNETILCIHPSAEVSGTVRSATVAARLSQFRYPHYRHAHRRQSTCNFGDISCSMGGRRTIR